MTKQIACQAPATWSEYIKVKVLGRSNGVPFSEAKTWLSDPELPGTYFYTVAQQSIRPIGWFYLSDPDVALELKLRFG